MYVAVVQSRFSGGRGKGAGAAARGGGGGGGREEWGQQG